MLSELKNKLSNKYDIIKNIQKTDSLARSVRKQLSFVVHMDANLPVWFADSI